MIQSNETIKEIPTKKNFDNNKNKEKEDRHNDPHQKKKKEC